MTSDERSRALQRLHALMAHTVVNGCTEEEELAAARMAGRLAEDILGRSGGPHGHDEPAGTAQKMRAERESAEYQSALEKSMLEGLLKSALQELALSHINTLAPPGRAVDGLTQWLDVRHLLLAHLGMVLGVANSRTGRKVLADTIEELVQDGMLPDRLAVASERG